MKLILVRHGHVEGIFPQRFRGRMDLPLTALGRAQAAALGSRIARTWRPAAIYTSPLGRCIDTGAAISQATGVQAKTLEALADFDYGSWQGRSWTEVEQTEPDRFALWFLRPELASPGGADTLQALVHRTSDALRSLMEKYLELTVVWVGHDSTNRALLLQLLDQPLSAYWRLAQDPCGLSEVLIEGSEVTVIRLNDTSHLDEVHVSISD